MKTINLKELKEIIQSGHINLLLGSGCSRPFLAVLGDIESKMNDVSTSFEAKKEYYALIKKSKSVLDESLLSDTKDKNNLAISKNNYDAFMDFWAKTISNRHLHIVNKQINIFTTNFDMFLEDSCERLSIPYNDGFSGQIKPIFGATNFNKIQRYKSLQFDNISDIPLFNIIKLHGSASWQINGDKIYYSDTSHIPENLDGKDENIFDESYKKIAVINPSAEKHFETVLNTNYAALLRKFTLELEKENSILFIFGFSLADKHIKELLYGVMKSNPTLIIIYFSKDKYDETADKLEERKSANFFVISPSDSFPFEESTNYLNSIFRHKNGNTESQVDPDEE